MPMTNLLPKFNIAIIISFISFPSNHKFNSTFVYHFLEKQEHLVIG